MNPSSAMALVSAGVVSAAWTVVGASTAASAAAMRFSLRVVFIVVSFRWLIGWVISLRLESLNREVVVNLIRPRSYGQHASQKPWFSLHPGMAAKTCTIDGRRVRYS